MVVKNEIYRNATNYPMINGSFCDYRVLGLVLTGNTRHKASLRSDFHEIEHP